MIHDFGIDAHVEITNEDYPTGQLIAIQIKSGMSFFSEENTHSYVFRTEDKHIEYWSNHTLPVILVLYNPHEEALFWQAVNESNVTTTGKGWKLEVPKEQKLDDLSLVALRKLTQPEPYIQKLNKLKLDRYWMEKVNKGYDVYVEFDDWINKSLNRYQINLCCEGECQPWPVTYCPGMSIADALGFFLSWADFQMDMEAHREGSISQWNSECYMTYDKEERRAIHHISFEEWYVEPEEIVPYQENGEIASYRLLLGLNELGKSFIEMDSFLSDTNKFQDKIFTIEDLQW